MKNKLHNRLDRKLLFLVFLAFTVPVVQAATQWAYVSNLSGNNVSVVNATTGVVNPLISVPTGPNGLAVTPDGTALYVVTQSTNQVSVISTATNTVLKSITVGSGPV